MTMAKLTPEQHYARDLTERIKRSLDNAWELIVEAHSAEVWTQLGYPGWKQYVEAEFGMSERHSYRLLDQARITKQLREAAVTTDPRVSRDDIHISEREARDIAPLVGEVVERVEAGAPVVEAVREVRASVRSVGRERVVFSDEESDEPHEFRCPRCGFAWDGIPQ